MDLAAGPEAQTRCKRIDVMLRDAGLLAQDRRELDFTASMDVVVQEVQRTAACGFAAYHHFSDVEGNDG